MMFSITPSRNAGAPSLKQASLAAITVVLLAMASGPLMAGNPASSSRVIKWSAMPELDIEKSATSCGHRFTEQVVMTFDGKILRSTGWSGMTYDMILQEPLNADGSGFVQAISMPKGRTLMLEFPKFDPDKGPPEVSFYGLFGGRCVWKFRSLVDEGA